MTAHYLEAQFKWFRFTPSGILYNSSFNSARISSLESYATTIKTYTSLFTPWLTQALDTKASVKGVNYNITVEECRTGGLVDHNRLYFRDFGSYIYFYRTIEDKTFCTIFASSNKHVLLPRSFSYKQNSSYPLDIDNIKNDYLFFQSLILSHNQPSVEADCL